MDFIRCKFIIFTRCRPFECETRIVFFSFCFFNDKKKKTTNKHNIEYERILFLIGRRFE